MRTAQLKCLIDQLCSTSKEDPSRQTDGELLTAFCRSLDQSAFEALLHRHGPMVLGVCRRLLDNEQDVADAFQATWVVLMRRAAAIVPAEAVGNWLYGVAYRTALHARRDICRRRVREKQVSEMPQPSTEPEDSWLELQPLDEELNRLPDRYRLPLVLCDLEGQPRREVARQLAMSERTLASRLAAARQRLAQRLSSRGVTLTSASLALLLVRHAAASVPAPLVHSLVVLAGGLVPGAALAPPALSANVSLLANGVLRSMLLSKLKLASLLLVLACTLVGGGLWLPGRLAGPSAVAAAPEPLPQEPDPKKADPKKADEKPADQKNEPAGETAVRERLKKHEEEIARIRAAMLKECDDELKKLDEAIKKAEKDLAAAKTPAARSDAFHVKAKLLRDRLQVTMLRAEIERKLRLGVPVRAETEEHRLGIHTTPVSPVLVKQLALEKDRGMLVTRVDAGSAAEKAGLKEYDILLQIDGKPVPGHSDSYQKLLASLKTDTPVDFVVMRGGKQETVKGVSIPATALKAERKKPIKKKPEEKKPDDKKSL
jgi:RNA polymerase sigma factor (sigma-70 family)